ncbi:Flp pilus assembly complex ATPase component TadA [bacterium]|nr:Flp pilus assembly complex ATPase component TadA [bacterium]
MKRLGDILVDEGLISADQLKEALAHQQKVGKKLGQMIVDLGMSTPDEILEALSRQMGIEKVDLFEETIDLKAGKVLSVEKVQRHKAIPIKEVDGTLFVAMVDPLNVIATDDIRLATGKKVKPLITTEESFKHAFDEYFGKVHEAEKAIKEFEKAQGADAIVAEELAALARDLDVNDAPIVKLCDSIFRGAVEGGASDIHLEPKETKLVVRYRVDGILSKIMDIPKTAVAAVVARVKIMSNLDTSERRKPLDGRIFMEIGTKRIDFRVSTIPTVHGEKVVARVLDRSASLLTLEDLGFNPKELKLWENLLTRPHGIILLTGPTGSGKTTTLNASLSRIAGDTNNVTTIEDPVEYEIASINQVQVNNKVGLTFTTALRSFLRQDPDIMMVGEIRDFEVGEMAIQASLTGHLVFSTLHTNDAPSSITRLVQMGIEPFMVNATLAAAVAQRLVRILCGHCKEGYEISDEEWNQLEPVFRRAGYEKESKPVLYKPVGCKFCGGSGMKGRRAIFEMMEMNSKLREMCLQGASQEALKIMAIKDGMDTLFQSGIRKVLTGDVAMEELFRVVPPEEMHIELGGVVGDRESETKKRAPELAEAPKMLTPFVRS